MDENRDSLRNRYSWSVIAHQADPNDLRDDPPAEDYVLLDEAMEHFEAYEKRIERLEHLVGTSPISLPKYDLTRIEEDLSRFGYRSEMFADGRFLVTDGRSSAEAKNLDELIGILSGVRLGSHS